MIAIAAGLAAFACSPQGDAQSEDAGSSPSTSDVGAATVAPEPDEVHLRNIRQLTLGGENAEAYFSPDDRSLILQSTHGEYACDQIFTLALDAGELQLVSTGLGRTTCAYFFPAGDKILYSSTHLDDPACPPPPDYSQGYVWSLYPSYDIFVADRDGQNLVQLTDSWRYDAEATISRDGQKIVFTSLRDGDLDIYVMDADGSNVKRLTDQLGYDGGPFFSYDGTKIVYRAYHPQTAEESADYLRLLEQNMIRPSQLDIFIMDADGSNKRQLTDNGAANFAPYFFPSGGRVIFSSNMHNPEGRDFDLYAINIDGTGLERITYHQEFDGFPMFNSDGSQLVWGSNRHNARPGDTNIFIADWID
ncbi:MAG: PD40 domain-containing protein [Gemmatimonadota bacterium]|nr:MAG: PD40 domain-containing protein [Gemmatimonadota bacterium]